MRFFKEQTMASQLNEWATSVDEITAAEQARRERAEAPTLLDLEPMSLADINDNRLADSRAQNP